jgi:diaminohydroxyphosphoribosylaminopyrimidine deaminase/5-amino-6-(5-phosphoribosylamino)uracil reductase
MREPAWPMLLEASRMAEALDREGAPRLIANDALAWVPGKGWESRLPQDDPRNELLSLYLPLASATTARPITVGHLGQSLDGFIATPSGDSQFVTGNDNLVNIHRMRALSDAIVVGAGTVAADDPQLTTRHVEGPNPLRVVIDSGRRLQPTFKLFTDQQVETIYVCARSRIAPGETHMAAAVIVGIEEGEPGEEAAQVLRLLRARGCARVFVEGGGVTVSTFLEADLLDRLQIAIAPVLIGEGRPAIRLTPQRRLQDCRRPGYRVFKMGGDVLFDCELKAVPAAEEPATSGEVQRII